MRRKELFYHVTLGSNVTRDVHWCVTVDYQQIANGNIANQVHGFTIDYGKFILNNVNCCFPLYEYMYIQTNESTNCIKYITLNHNRYFLQQLIGLTNRIFWNILIRAFCFFPSTGQMDCVWRNDSYLYNNVRSSEVLNMMCTEKAIICF